jgi:hypothetical protein
MYHRRRFIFASLLSANAILLASGAYVHAPVMDDIAHLASGVSNWELGRFDLYKVNPPLVRELAALPVLAAGAKTDYRSYSHSVGARAEFEVMEDFVRANGPRVIWLLTLARWGLMPLALLGGYICYRWARELYGDAAGIAALLLWCFCPNVLAYAQTLTADAGAAALGVTASYCFWRWLRDPESNRAIVAGIVLGLAELTKTTWLVLFGLWPALWVVWAVSPRCKVQSPKSEDKAEGKRQKANDGSGVRVQGSGSGRKSHGFCYQLMQLGLILALGVFCINAGYDFEGSGTKLRDYQFISGPLTGLNRDAAERWRPGNRFAKSWLGKLPVPLPRSYVEGTDLQWHDIERGKPSYLRGHWQERGWWYWYLYALTVKVPLGTWGLFLLAGAVRLAHFSLRSKVQGPTSAEKAEGRRQKAKEQSGKTEDLRSTIYVANPKFKIQHPKSVTWRDELVLLAPAAAVLALVSSQAGFSRYLRYVLPMFPFVFIWISSVAGLIEVEWLVKGGRKWRGWRGSVTVRKRKGNSAARQSGDESPHSKGQSDASLRAKILAVVILGLLAWSVGSCLWYTPHWMSYFNELAGGPMGGPAHLIDAQVDWGQDLLYLKKWLDAHPEARPLGVVYFGPINPTLAGIDFTLPPKGTPATDDRNAVARVPRELKPGWYAISVNYLYGYDHYIYAPDGSRAWVTKPYYSYFRRFEPVATAGYSIYIYHLTAGDMAAFGSDGS